MVCRIISESLAEQPRADGGVRQQAPAMKHSTSLGSGTPACHLRQPEGNLPSVLPRAGILTPGESRRERQRRPQTHDCGPPEQRGGDPTVHAGGAAAARLPAGVPGLDCQHQHGDQRRGLAPRQLRAPRPPDDAADTGAPGQSGCRAECCKMRAASRAGRGLLRAILLCTHTLKGWS